METTAIQVIFIFIFIILVIYGIYRLYKRYNTATYSFDKGVILANPSNAKSTRIFSGKELPIVDNGYTLSMWFWIDDWDYKLGEYKHIFHRGDLTGTMVQPLVMLHPTENKLIVRLDKLDDTDRSLYRIFRNQVFPSVIATNYNAPTFENTTVENVKNQCNEDDACSGFTAIQDDSGNVYSAYVSHIDDEEPTVDNMIASSKDLKSFLSRNNYSLVTYKKYRHQYLNPFLNDDKLISSSELSPSAISELVIPNIPLNRWVHFAMVVTGNTIEAYLNGLLQRTVTMSHIFKPNQGDIYVCMPGDTTNNPGFSGLISKIGYYNDVLMLDDIVKIYHQGPTVTSDMKFNITEQPVDQNKINNEVAGLVQQTASSSDVTIGPDGSIVEKDIC